MKSDCTDGNVPPRGEKGHQDASTSYHLQNQRSTIGDLPLIVAVCKMCCCKLKKIGAQVTRESANGTVPFFKYRRCLTCKFLSVKGEAKELRNCEFKHNALSAHVFALKWHGHLCVLAFSTTFMAALFVVQTDSSGPPLVSASERR